MIPKIMTSEAITECLISKKPVTKILDFGVHAYADTFIAQDQLNLSEPAFPLQLYLCEETGSIQLGYISNADDRYNLYPYSYTSSNSAYSRKHWDEYAAWVKGKFKYDDLIVEIGSNDGYLINQFKNNTGKNLGVDPSKRMCEIAKENGVTTIWGLFDKDVAAQMRELHGGADVIIANNVFNHANDPVDFAKGVHSLLKDDGVFIFELPYWGDMMSSGRFPDMVYHEHISYFTVTSAYHLLKAADMRILEVNMIDYHGKSIRIVACKGFMDEIEDTVAETMLFEKTMGWFDPSFYKKLQHNLEVSRDQWLQEFYRIKSEEPDAVIIGVGAAAKANTWLNWHGLNGSTIHAITDASPFKQGKYTPRSRIPILGDEEFAKHINPYALILSWNISGPLKEALLKINPNTKFISQ